MVDYVHDNEISYDRLCSINIKTENGMIGRVVQDVITEPSKKYVFIQGSKGSLTWYLNFEDSNDRIELFNNLKNIKFFEFKKIDLILLKS